MSLVGKYPGDMGHDDDAAWDVSELPIEYRVKLNGFLRNACADGHETLTRVLLDKGADVNYISSNTQLSTALHVAVSNTKESILSILLTQASNATIQSALQYAIQYQAKLAAIIKLLQKSDPDFKDNDKDKDKDQHAVANLDPFQRETETQTTPPPQKENQTQTNGSDNNTAQSDQPHDQNDHRSLQLKLEQQLKDQQSQLHDQQQKILEQQKRQEETQKSLEQAQLLATQAQHNAELLKQQVEKQKEQLGDQDKEVQKLKAQIAQQESQIQKLADDLASRETERQSLNDKVGDQQSEIQRLHQRIEELERENKELSSNLVSHNAKHEATVQDFQAQITALQKDIELKSKKIEKISSERDSERRAKEVAKRILSSNGPRDSPEPLPHSHAIRMGTAPSPTPDDPQSPTLASSGGLKGSGTLRSRINGLVISGPTEGSKPGEGKVEAVGMLKKSRTSSDMQLMANVGTKKGLSSKSRAKDDMDIASEADRARVRRLVARWEDMKYLEIPTKQP